MRGALIAALALTLGLGRAAAGQVEVRASVRADTVALGESVEYRVSVSGAGFKDVEEPEVEPPHGLSLLGSEESSEVSIAGGSVERRREFTLVYRPFRTGTISIGPATVRVGDARYEAPAVSVTVLEARFPGALVLPVPPGAEAGEFSGAGEAGGRGLPAVFVTNRLDRDDVYVGEQAVLTFAFYQSSRAVILDQPNYSSAKTPGFWTQDLNSEPEITRELIGGEPYTVQRFHYALFPLTPGDKAIAPAALTLTLRQAGSFLDRGHTRTITGDTLRLNVRALPEAGRPPDFEGAVGRYRLAARVEPRELEREAPAAIVLTVSGEGNIATIPGPRLPPITGLKLFDPEVKMRLSQRGLGVEGEKEFRYLMVPKRSGRLALGEASLAYFDPREGAYRRAVADLGALAVLRPQGEIKLGKKGEGAALAEIRVGAVGGSSMLPWRSPLYWTLAALPFLVLGLLLARSRRQPRRRRPPLVRLPGATELRHDSSAAGVARVKRSVLDYLATRYQVALSGRSLVELQHTLLEAGVPAERAARAAAAVQALDALGFAPPATRPAAFEGAVAALRELEHAEGPGRRRFARA